MNLNTRNYPPQSGIRVPAEEMKALTVRLFEAVDMTGVDAEVLANILNINGGFMQNIIQSTIQN